MKNIFQKLNNKILSLVLCICIVSGATAPAYATSTAPDTSYFVNNGYKTWSGPSGSHSLSNGMKLGDIVSNGIQYLSLDLQAMYSGLNQLYTSVTSNTTNVSNIYTIINGLMSGWYSADSVLNPPNGYNNSWYWRVLQALGNLQTAFDDDSIIYHLSNIYSSLNHWNGTSSDSIADLVAGIDEYQEDIASNTAISASAADQILQAVKKTNGKYFEYYTRGNFPNGNFNDVTISTSETYGAYHANGDGSYQFGSLSGVSDRLEFLAWLHSDLLNVMGMMQTPNTIYKTEYVNADYTTTSAISLSLQDSVVLGNRVITDTLSKIYNERKDIDWITNGAYLGYNTSLSTTYDTNTIYSTKFYGYFNLDNSNSGIYKVILPFRFYRGDTQDLNVTAGFYNGTDLPMPNSVISYNVNTSDTEVIIYIPNEPYALNKQFYICLESDKAIQCTKQTGYVYSVNTDTKDFYDVQNFVYNFNFLDLLRQAKFMFFDDKTIAAKKVNQSQEDTFLDNFTGSGSASASSSDFGAVKDSMVDFKAGFSGGASSSDTFSFMAGDSDAWDWFTQETANDLDRTQGSNTRLLRGSSDVAYDTPLLDSYYTSILSILGGDR